MKEISDPTALFPLPEATETVDFSRNALGDAICGFHWPGSARNLDLSRNYIRTVSDECFSSAGTTSSRVVPG